MRVSLQCYLHEENLRSYFKCVPSLKVNYKVIKVFTIKKKYVSLRGTHCETQGMKCILTLKCDCKGYM